MSDMMSQEEIESMLKAGQSSGTNSVDVNAYLSKEEQDTLGEIGNICMGTSATTMYTLLGRRVEITTPTVDLFPTKEAMFKDFSMPFIVVEVEYIAGVDGNNLLLLSQEDAALITDVLMGGEGVISDDFELGDLHISAINEVMNQMVGSAATSLANVLKEAVNISTPKTFVVDFADDKDTKDLDIEDPLIRISFDMEIENLLKSKLMQVMPLSFGTQLVGKLKELQAEEAAPRKTPPPAHPPAPAQSAPASAQSAPPPAQSAPASAQSAPPPAQSAPAPAQSTPPPAQSAPPPSAPQSAQPTYSRSVSTPIAHEARPVDVQPVAYRSFDAEGDGAPPVMGDIELLSDVPLQVTVELGKTKKSIKEVLEIGLGSIIMLDRLAGEPVDIVVNGKLIARGEVVVIDDSYGVRITDIVTPSRRV